MNKLRFSWLVALVATLGSLYFSEVKKYIPCTLCWYQRILMYPLVIFLGVAMVRNDKKIAYYVLPLSILGILFSGYHYLEQKVSFFAQLIPCKTGVPCSTDYINWLGFITIPLLAFTAFVLITITMILMIRKEKSNSVNE